MKWIEGLLMAVVVTVCVAIAPSETQAKSYTIRITPLDENLDLFPQGQQISYTYRTVDASPPVTYGPYVMSTATGGTATVTHNLGSYVGDLLVTVTGVTKFEYLIEGLTGTAYGHDPEVDLFPHVEPKVYVKYYGTCWHNGNRLGSGTPVDVIVSNPNFSNVNCTSDTDSSGDFENGTFFNIQTHFRTGTISIVGVGAYTTYTPNSMSIGACSWDSTSNWWVANWTNFGDVDCD